MNISSPVPRRTQRFPVSVVASVRCSGSLCESLRFLRFDLDRVRWFKFGAEFRLDFEWLINRRSSSSSDDDCRWRLNVFGDDFSLRFRRLTLFESCRVLCWDDDDDCFECVRFRCLEFLGSSSSSSITGAAAAESSSGSLRRLFVPVEIASSALNFAWRVVGGWELSSSSSSSSSKKQTTSSTMIYCFPTVDIRIVRRSCRCWFPFGSRTNLCNFLYLVFSHIR